MVSRSLSYALRLTGETDPSLPRAFGSVSREIEDTNRRISETRAEQEKLNRELRGARRGTEEYDRLQGEVERARGEMSRLTGALDRQQESWTTLNRRSTQFRNATLAGIGVLGAAAGGLLLQVDRLGESSAQILAIANSTGLAVEEVQRLQRVVGLTGFDLDIGDFNEISIRLGEIRQEAEDTNASKALEAIGLSARTVSTRDLPEIIRKLQEVDDVQRRAFLADEILGGTFAERVIPALDIPQEQLDRLNRVPTLTREQAEQFRNAKVELEAFKQQFGQTAATVGSAFLPQITAALMAVEPLVAGFAAFAQDNPGVLVAIAAIGAATVTLTGILWAANAARAVGAALTPGVGWAALAAAAVIGGGVAALGASAVSRGRAALAEGSEQQGNLTSGIQTAAREGTMEGSLAAAEELKNFNTRTLDNILPRIECLEGNRPPAGGVPVPGPSANPLGLTPEELVRLSVAIGRPGSPGTHRINQGANAIQTDRELGAVERRLGLGGQDFVNAGFRPSGDLNPFDAADRRDLLQLRADLLEARGELQPANAGQPPQLGARGLPVATPQPFDATDRPAATFGGVPLSPAERAAGVTIIQHNNITTSQVAEEAQAEMEDAFRLANVEQ